METSKRNYLKFRSYAKLYPPNPTPFWVVTTSSFRSGEAKVTAMATTNNNRNFIITNIKLIFG
ncbi:CLUMA_CG016735, isoform A [Clunio marinus]|uniref:CLUMA_CG016735, isoform A n=1 Tax=Clunio marinus TaxID=568069 RepID=A0A1J1ITE7_9DIPT|nr:CLUMA_CG016735, isoform A [Clunio marinus]